MNKNLGIALAIIVALGSAAVASVVDPEVKQRIKFL